MLSDAFAIGDGVDVAGFTNDLLLISSHPLAGQNAV